MTLGRRIAERRKKLGLSQEALGERLERSFVLELETGQTLTAAAQSWVYKDGQMLERTAESYRRTGGAQGASSPSLSL